MEKITIAFCSFACASYSKEILSARSGEAMNAIKALGLEVIDAGYCSTFEDADRSIILLKNQDFDFFLACIPSWIETPVVMRVLMEYRHKPLLVWGLGGYTQNRSLVSPAAPAGTSALRETLDKFGFTFRHIYEWPDSPLRPEQVERFANAVNTVKKLFHSRIGMMGYADMGLYSTMFDGVSLRSKIGPEVEVFDMLEVVQKQDTVLPSEINDFIARLKADWTFEQQPNQQTLEKLAKIYLAVEKIIIERGFSAFSLKCVEGMKKYMQFPPCMVQTLLADRYPSICEDDALGLVTQLILKYTSGQSTTFVETYEFFKDSMLVGVCGYAPFQYLACPVKASVYAGWGGLNAGMMNTSAMKTGLITLARLGYRRDEYYLHLLRAQAEKPMKWEEMGWNPPAPEFPGLLVKPEIPVETFVEKIISQHYLLVYGDFIDQLKDVCYLLGIKVIE